MEMSQVIRQRRQELGLSQVELAALVGIDTRQIRRYESGKTHPVLPVAAEIARALKITLDELAGAGTHRVDLAGAWWVAWQAIEEAAATPQEVRIDQRGDLLSLRTVAGCAHLHGELRLWDNEVLMGWYVGAAGPVGAQGTLYYAVLPHAPHLSGRWVSQVPDRAIVTGWTVLAREPQIATEVLQRLATPGPGRGRI